MKGEIKIIKKILDYIDNYVPYSSLKRLSNYVLK